MSAGVKFVKFAGNNHQTMDKGRVFCGLAVMVGLIVLGAMIPRAVEKYRSYDRTVNVKGLCEKEVKADKVIWPVVYKVMANDIQSIYDQTDSNNASIISFLKSGGIGESEITVSVPQISDKLAYAYADYVNTVGFTDEDGKPLTLEKSQSGIYQAGSYYDYIKAVIENSLNHYLSDNKLTGSAAQEYINGLNADKKWIAYDQKTNTASITSVEDFVKTCKNASELPVAFDWPGSGNTLFGKSNGRGAHFDKLLSGVLTELNSQYAAEYAADMDLTDTFSYTVEQRVHMYTPLYYLLKSSEGYGTSTAAKHWRIRTGIEQPTTSLTTEVNLVLALMHCDGVADVDFETVWEQGHEPVEREGDSTENFIRWVNNCIK